VIFSIPGKSANFSRTALLGTSSESGSTLKVPSLSELEIEHAVIEIRNKIDRALIVVAYSRQIY
jgi:hypothetical protein